MVMQWNHKNVMDDMQYKELCGCVLIEYSDVNENYYN